MSRFKSFARKIIPPKIWKLLSFVWNPRKGIESVYYYYLIKTKSRRHNKALKLVKKKDNIQVAFFLINADIWKYDAVYWSFVNSPRFNPVVVICPFISKGNEFLLSQLEKSEAYCKAMGYNYRLGYEKDTKKVLPIKKMLNPDIVFFSNPNKITVQEFLISNYTNTLTCFLPYTFRISSLYAYEYNNRMVNLCWRVFYETKIHKELAVKHAKNKGNNVVISGHPHLDRFKENNSDDPWKTISAKNKRKRIIWAPHWTIKGYQNTGLDWACFLDYADFILDLADEFSIDIQFALKPHPFLRLLLEKEELWGKKRTDEYFSRWDSSTNTQLIEGDYVQLFKHSDALVHDSGAFMAEYLIIDKPTAYTVNSEKISQTLNEFGNAALNVHINIFNKEDLHQFVLDVVNDVDRNQSKRNAFINNYFPNQSHSASQNIVNHIASKL